MAEKVKKQMGRPPKPFNWDKLDAAVQFGAQQQMCADLLDVSMDLIEIRVREKYDLTFSEYRAKRMANTKLTLVQKAIDMGMKGNVTMLIWVMKNLCGWTDKREESIKIERIDTKTKEDLLTQARLVQEVLVEESKLLSGPLEIDHSTESSSSSPSI